MPEVLEVEQVETTENETAQPKWDSWTVEIPQAIIEAQNLPKGSLAVFTIKNKEIEGEIIASSPELDETARRILEKRHGLYQELKRLGD